MLANEAVDVARLVATTVAVGVPPLPPRPKASTDAAANRITIGMMNHSIRSWRGTGAGGEPSGRKSVPQTEHDPVRLERILPHFGQKPFAIGYALFVLRCLGCKRRFFGHRATELEEQVALERTWEANTG